MGLTTQKYDILTRIAIGNGSLVYKGVDKESLRKVAIKLLTKDDELDHGYDVEALFESLPRLRQITGSHVCQLLDAVNDDDGPVLIYEFAGGISGAEFPQQRKLDAAQAVDVAAQLMSSIRSGERQKTPHGDLKPSNVMFVDTPEKRPFTFVLDWGLAAFRPELTKDSRPYLAPERLAGAGLSHQADLFAAGALLFYLLTGKILAAGETDEELLAAWAKVRPEVLADLRPDLPARFVQWVASLLAIDPAKRPWSAVDAATALGPLNPPAPMVPPEDIRPRPLSASQRAQQAGLVSGVNAPPVSRAAPPPASGISRPSGSGVRPASTISAVPSQTSPSAHAPAGSAKAAQLAGAPKKRVAVIAALLVFLVGATAATVTWWVRRERVSPIPEIAQTSTPTAAEAAAAKISKTLEKPAGALAGAPAKPAPAPKKEVAAAKEPSAKPAKKETAKASSPKPSPPPKNVATAKAPEKQADAKAGAMNVNVALSVSSGADSAAMPAAPASALAAPAEVVAEESFDYSNGSIVHGQKAGRGWIGNWDANGAKIRDGSLSYPGHLASGGMLILPSAAEMFSARRIMAPVSKFIEDPAKGGKWYVSMLVRNTVKASAAIGESRIHVLDADDSGKVPYISLTNVGTGLRVALSGSTESPIVLPDASKAAWLVCQINAGKVVNGRSDLTLFLLVNPQADAPQFVKATTTFKLVKAEIKGAVLPAQTGVLIRKLSGGAETAIDEVRYAEHWAELRFGPPVVLPSPPPPVGKAGGPAKKPGA